MQRSPASMQPLGEPWADAARRADRLVDRQHDLGHHRLVRALGQPIAAARTAHALHQPAFAQPREQLFQITERNLLTRGDLGQGHGPARGRRPSRPFLARSAIAITAYRPLVDSRIATSLKNRALFGALVLEPAPSRQAAARGRDLESPTPAVKYYAACETTS